MRPHPLVHVAPHIVGEGQAFLAAALGQGLEGVVAKRRRSRYRPGERTGDWVKIKAWAQQDVAVIRCACHDSGAPPTSGRSSSR